LQFNLWLCAIADGLNFYPDNTAYLGGDREIMHAINVMIFIAFKPAFSTRDTQLSFEMHLSDSTF